MKPSRAVFLVLGLTVLFGLGGMLIGLGLAKLVPGYYHAAFPRSVQQGTDPAEFGAGLGLVQGLITGLIVAVVLVLAYALVSAWRSRRTSLHDALEELAREMHELRQAFAELRAEVSARPPAGGGSFITEKRPQPGA